VSLTNDEVELVMRYGIEKTPAVLDRIREEAQRGTAGAAHPLPQFNVGDFCLSQGDYVYWMTRLRFALHADNRITVHSVTAKAGHE
jgi:hypothetical protein